MKLNFYLTPATQGGRFLNTSVNHDQILAEQITELPFYQKVSDEEWIQALNQWSSSHNPNIPLLSDYAVSRADIYEDEEI